MHASKDHVPAATLEKVVKKALFLALLTAAAFASGCSTVTPPDSNMPWAQPAEWEKDNMLKKMGGASY
jgi:hypothetical protein